MSGAFTMSSSYPADAAPTRNPRGGVAPGVRTSVPVASVAARPRVLCVDDDASLNRVAERLLPRNGFDVDSAIDASSALRLAERGDHDAILLDQRLPDAPDLEVLRRLRHGRARIPVVVLTGHHSVEAAIDALTLGITDYLVKPARNERILAALRIAVRVRSCEPLLERPSIVLHTEVSLPLVSTLFNLPRADEGQLRTQLAWAVADEDLSFLERVAAVEALVQVFAPATDAERLRQVDGWLRRGLGRRFSDLSPIVRTFVELITVDALRTLHRKTEALAAEVGVSMGELSRLVRHELGVAPDRCRLIGHLGPALRELAHSTEQVAQIAYQVGYNLHTTFDNRFKELWGLAPRRYRELLTGLVDDA